MVEAGLMQRSAYAEAGQRRRAEYHLTDKGWDLVPVLLALGQWSERWTPAPEGPTAKVTERSTGRAVSVVMTADPKARSLTMDDLRVALGPGARRIG